MGNKANGDINAAIYLSSCTGEAGREIANTDEKLLCEVPAEDYVTKQNKTKLVEKKKSTTSDSEGEDRKKQEKLKRALKNEKAHLLHMIEIIQFGEKRGHITTCMKAGNQQRRKWKLIERNTSDQIIVWPLFWGSNFWERKNYPNPKDMDAVYVFGHQANKYLPIFSIVFCKGPKSPNCYGPNPARHSKIVIGIESCSALQYNQ